MTEKLVRAVINPDTGKVEYVAIEGAAHHANPKSESYRWAYLPPYSWESEQERREWFAIEAPLRFF